MLTMPAEGFILKPGAFVLGWTEELIRLPHTSRLAARVEGRSSLARLGVGVHVTAPIIHAGFGCTRGPGLPGNAHPAGDLELWRVARLPPDWDEGLPVDPRGGPRHAGEGLRRRVCHPGPRTSRPSTSKPRREAAQTPAAVTV